MGVVGAYTKRRTGLGTSSIITDTEDQIKDEIKDLQSSLIKVFHVEQDTV